MVVKGRAVPNGDDFRLDPAWAESVKKQCAPARCDRELERKVMWSWSWRLVMCEDCGVGPTEEVEWGIRPPVAEELIHFGVVDVTAPCAVSIHCLLLQFGE